MSHSIEPIGRDDQICDVVFQPNQFSWTRYKYKVPHKDDVAWKRAIKVAKTVRSYPDVTRGAKYFFNPQYTQARSITTGRVKTNKIGGHVFYADTTNLRIDHVKRTKRKPVIRR